MEEVSCSCCGKPKMVKKSKIGKSKNFFCDIKCKAKWQSLFCKGEKHHNFNSVLVNCGWCGKEKYVCQFDLKRRNGNFFCDKKCKGKWHSQTFVKEKSWNYDGGERSVPCVICGKIVKRPKWKIENHPNTVCGNECLATFMKDNFSGKNSPHWRGGISFEDYSVYFNTELKQIIRERDEFKCQMCFCDEGDQKHSVHHIDYDKNNSSFYNLISLCRSCHSKTTNSNRKYYTRFLKEYLNKRYSNEEKMEV